MNDQLLFHHTLHHSPIGMAVLNLEGQILQANDVLCKMVGYTEKELFLLSSDTITHPGDLYLDTYYLGKFLNEDINECQFQKRLFHKNGQMINVLINVSLVRNEKQQPFLFVSQIQDITKQLKNEEIRRITESRLNHFLDSISDAFLAVDHQCRYTYINKEAERFLNCPREEMIGKVMWEFFPDEINSIFYDQFYRALINKAPVKFEKVYALTETWIEVRIYPSDDGASIYFSDITERKKIEKELRDSEERYRTFVESSADAILVCSCDERLVFINEAGINLLGVYHKSEVIGLPVDQFFLPEDLADFKEKFRSILLNSPFQNPIVVKLLRPDGSIVEVEATCATITYNGQKSIQCIARDVTERNRLDQHVRKSEKLSLVGELAAGVAHEVRNPLTSIKGFLQFTQNLKEYKEEYVEIMLQELERVETIIYEFLTLAKPSETLVFSEHDLELLLTQVVTLQETQAIMKNIEIKTKFSKVPLISCHPNQLKQVFVNIIQNAIEATPAKGIVTVQIDLINVDMVGVTVIDNGCGIAKDRISRLGEPFYSNKEKGTGLGLMVSHKIIENHKGSILFQSEEGKGTIVKILLPLHPCKSS
ncbi:PAS domain S-box protein [Anaerobacillus alkaliphilus]|uniref:histidine kinase n=1 Tax=Anaerobacillus alkaliphilus TaxID=1548597 RepID=A0A4Q0VSC1_9BACI|nr:PAS domain S-box protein [Anaerobacillus alkaliphilus]RXJ00703.1 PAS domain S-box protein [Anaerobacillus alkaliphilus]